MHLTQQEINQFFKIWCALIWGVNEKHIFIPKFEKPIYGTSTMIKEPFIHIREELWKNPNLIDEFIRDYNYGELSEAELGILADWRKYFVKGRFIVIKHTKKYSVFMTESKPTKLYGVCGISDSIKDTLPHGMPFIVNAVILPFNSKIIYDSLLASYNISLGKNIRDDLKSAYKKTLETVGIIENMELLPIPAKSTEKNSKATKPVLVVDTKGANVPNAMSARYMEIAQIIEDFCDEKLDADYKELCLKALAKLCRKRPSPVASGRVRTWACGIVYAIGSNNFIFDKSQPISMTASEISEWFGLSKSTAGNKATEISRLLNLSYFDSEFTLPSFVEKSPMTWYLSVNGYMVDIRTMPREAQEIAFYKGLIPYIPADRKELTE